MLDRETDEMMMDGLMGGKEGVRGRLMQQVTGALDYHQSWKEPCTSASSSYMLLGRKALSNLGIKES